MHAAVAAVLRSGRATSSAASVASAAASSSAGAKRLCSSSKRCKGRAEGGVCRCTAIFPPSPPRSRSPTHPHVFSAAARPERRAPGAVKSKLRVVQAAAGGGVSRHPLERSGRRRRRLLLLLLLLLQLRAGGRCGACAVPRLPRRRVFRGQGAQDAVLAPRGGRPPGVHDRARVVTGAAGPPQDRTRCVVDVQRVSRGAAAGRLRAGGAAGRCAI